METKSATLQSKMMRSTLAYEAQEHACRLAVALKLTSMASSSCGIAEPASHDRKRQAPSAEKGRPVQMKRAKKQKSSAQTQNKTSDLIHDLSKHNSLLLDENASLRAKLEVCHAENARLQLLEEENKQLRLMHQEGQQRAAERNRALSALMHELQLQANRNECNYALDPPTRGPDILTPSTTPATPPKLTLASLLALQNGNDLQQRQSDCRHVHYQSNDFSNNQRLSNQNKIQHLRDDLKGVRDYLARHSI